MQCSDVRECLFAFLDSELESSLSVEVQRHLEVCCGCAREAEIEQAIHRSLRRIVPTPAPSLDRFLPIGGSAVERAADVPRSRGRIWGRRTMLTSAVLAGMMVIGVIWNQQTRAATFADSLVAEMSDLWSGRGQLDVASADPDQVIEWVRHTLGWDVWLADGAKKDRHLLGAVTHRVNGSRAVFVLYDVAGHPASVVVIPTAEADLRQMRPPTDDGDCYRDHCRGYTVMATRRGVLTYAAIGRLPEHELAALIGGRIAAR